MVKLVAEFHGYARRHPKVSGHTVGHVVLGRKQVAVNFLQPHFGEWLQYQLVTTSYHSTIFSTEHELQLQ